MSGDEFDPGELLGVLLAHHVQFVLIGGMAALAHGSPFPTEDLDITPNTQRDNLERLSAALRELRARIRVDGLPEGLDFDHDADSLAASTVWNLTTRFGDLDLAVLPAGTTGYADLMRSASATSVFDLTVSIASLGDVIRSKQAANRPKDQRVLPTLRELLANQPPRPKDPS